MEKEAGVMANISSDAVETTEASGKCGAGQTQVTMSTRHSKRQWRPASECSECRQPLEEWEVGICEGCGVEYEKL
jgi:hypothetical protein